MSAQMSSVVALLAVTNSRQAAESAFSWQIPKPDYSHGSLHCTFLHVSVAAVLVVATGPAVMEQAAMATGSSAATRP
jgi:hypothetical protein